MDNILERQTTKGTSRRRRKCVVELSEPPITSCREDARRPGVFAAACYGYNILLMSQVRDERTRATLLEICYIRYYKSSALKIEDYTQNGAMQGEIENKVVRRVTLSAIDSESPVSD